MQDIIILTLLKKLKNWQKVFLSSIVLFFLLVLFSPLPSPLFNTPHTTTLISNNGQLLSAAIATDQQWRFPPSDSIPYKFKTAIRIYEDEYFNYHFGINPISLLRALRQNIKAGKVVSGGSTLTMQTIRMAYGNKPRTYIQKAIELLAAVKMELFYSKAEILKTYADNAPFGGNIVGISAASYRYFGRGPHQLSWAETASLAVLPNNPSAIYPGKNEERYLIKRDFLLNKLHQKGIIDEDGLFLAKQEPLPQKVKSLPNQAFHLLHRKMNEKKTGTTIHSTLEANLQRRATQLVNAYSKRWAGNQVYNAAAIIVEIETGEVKAYIGNSVSAGEHGKYVDIITSKRSPGSLLKPILYAAALDEGLIMPNQLLPDIPLFYRGFSPKNFDRKFRGAVPANQALTSSLNVPFVHLLIDYGYEKFHQKLGKMGMASLTRPASHYGLSLILGGSETTLDELTSMYAGMSRSYQNFEKRPLKKGYAQSDYYPNRTENDMPLLVEELEEFGNLAAPSLGFTFSAMQQLNRPDQEAGWQQFKSSKPVAWKTGTSYGFRDGWAIGITDKHVIGVWMGNADGEGRPGLTGVQAAAPLLFQLIDLLPGTSNFNQPFGVTHKMCRLSGMRASAICKDITNISIPHYLESTPTCSYHQLLHLNKEETMQVNSNCYEVAQIKNTPWFVLPPVQAWYYQKYHAAYKKQPPFAPGCLNDNQPNRFELIYPRQFAKVFIPIEQDGQRGFAIFEAAHQDKATTLYWHLDNTYLGLTEGNHQMRINAEKGLHLLTIIDADGNELKRSFEVIS
ncbi:MAG: penicillin-binding protein 1C [Cyclobacteriaceae bacterium]|nr:penicillin-binding protein 1C [Cyclobacteriaceae bacterium]